MMAKIRENLANILIGIFVTSMIAYVSWSSLRLQALERADIMITSRIPAQYPPQDYRDMVTGRFDRLESQVTKIDATVQVNNQALNKVQTDIAVLIGRKP